MLQAMAKDPKNHYQETWKQIRNKIKKFKNIPAQYGKYLESQKEQNSTEASS
jgi:ubiquinone biosynthesis protein COQ9